MLQNTADSANREKAKGNSYIVRSKRHSEYLYRHTVVKNSWKGKYPRVLCIAKTHVATLQPDSLFRVTNKWSFGVNFIDVVPDPQSPTQLNLLFNKNSTVEKFSFSALNASERAEILTDIQRQRAFFDRNQSQKRGEVFPVKKRKSDDSFEDVVFEVAPHGIEHFRGATRQKTGEYLFMYIRGVTQVQDVPNSLVLGYGVQVKLHMFVFENESLKIRFIQLINEYASKYIGLPKYAAVTPLTQLQFDSDRLGFRRETLEVATEFSALKWGPRHPDAPVKRLLGTTAVALVERDPVAYNVVGAYFLSNIFALVRCEDDTQRFVIELKDPCKTKTYTAPQRDAFLAHLREACHSAGNTQVALLDKPTERGKRFSSFAHPSIDEVECGLLNALVKPQRYLCDVSDGSADYLDIVEFFNINVQYSGLLTSENKDGMFAENREKLIFNAVTALLQHSENVTDTYGLIQYLNALRRLCASRPGYSGVAVVPSLMRASGSLVTTALKSYNTATLIATLDYLNVLMCPQHNNYDVEHESINKNRLLSAKSLCDSLLNMLVKHTHEESASLLVQGILQFFVFALCPPHSETTDAVLFHRIIKDVVDIVGKQLFSLLNHPCDAIRFLAGQIIRVILEEGQEDQFKFMQRCALSEGGFLMEFNVAAFSKNRLLRDLARRLLAFWTYENLRLQDVLRRMIPMALLTFLQSPEKPPASELAQEVTRGVSQMPLGYMEHSGWFKKRFNPKTLLPPSAPVVVPAQTVVKDSNGEVNEADANGQNATGHLQEELCQTSGVRLRSRDIRVSPSLNWSMLFYQLNRDHRRPDLIWNHTTRSELKRAIEAELDAFETGAEAKSEKLVAWNYYEFEVHYASLDDELRIGQHYPRLLFENKTPVVDKPKDFFNDLYHRFLLMDDMPTKLECLHGMSILYSHYAESIGYFADLPFFVNMYRDTVDPAFRDRLLLFFAEVIKARHNVKLIVDAGGMDVLVSDVTLAQLHIDRPQLKVATNAIEGGGESLESLQGKEKEWYYTADGAKMGPVSYLELKQMFREGTIQANSKVWAQGIAGWKKVKEVSQLKWGMVAEGLPSILSFTEVTCTILDIFQRICAQYPSKDEDGALMQPPPKVKRLLTSPVVLPHIVQLLLTFDPSVCSRVHNLLYLLMEDSTLVGRFFLTGVFFFSLMYSGSDVLPMCKLFHMTHLVQSFTFSQSTNETVRHSILSPLFPPAMVCYLNNHGPERFADIFLGEYETPETVWGKEMRRFLSSKIAFHVSDFTARLLGNNTLLYQYCPIAAVEYEQLRNEIFCHQYYLRHLCNEQLYPDWTILEPVSFLRAILDTWRLELNKKPNELTTDLCLEELEITDLKAEISGDSFPLAKVRKAYFTLAAQFHPDKNPNGRERFEKIQKAYEFLTSSSIESSEPNPANIFLLLRSQSILFKRCSNVLKEYKYAGYELLLKLLKSELDDPEAFRKETILITPAAELCYFTVENVPLNADELQEEGGIHLITRSLNRAFEQITPRSGDEDVYVKVATFNMLTLAASGQFKDCRKKMVQEPSISYLASKGVALEGSIQLSRASIQACETQCLDATMQERIVRHGVVWHLLRYLFQYDVTLDETTLQLEEKRHVQLFANKAAIYALHALHAVAGICPDEKRYWNTVENRSIQQLLEVLLTPYIVQQMRAGVPEKKILDLLNSNVQTPYFLWNNSTRAELEDLLQQNSRVCSAAGMDETPLDAWDKDSFGYEAHKSELIVGGVFLRLFLEQPNFEIQEPSQFLQSLINFIVNDCDAPSGAGAPSPKDRQLVVTCMHQIVSRYPDDTHDLVTMCMDVFVDLLSPKWPVEVHKEALSTLECLVKYQDCVSSLGHSEVVVSYFILVLRKDSEEVVESLLKYLSVIIPVCRSLVQLALDKGLYILLLGFLSSRTGQQRLSAATCLSKLFEDKLIGPKLLINASKFLPAVICETMKGNPTQACLLLDSNQENPELIWNETKRRKFASTVTAVADRVVQQAEKNPSATYSFGEEEQQLLKAPVTDACVGGVYLSLYREQSSWAVRKPKQFLTDLIDQYMAECTTLLSKDSPKETQDLLQLMLDCAVRLLSSTPSLRDSLATMGYVDKLAKQVASPNEIIVTNGLKWFYEMTQSSLCVETLCANRENDPIALLRDCHAAHPSQLPIILECLEKMVSNAPPQGKIVEKALRNKLLELLLGLLEKGVNPSQMENSNPAAIRALIVRILKGLLAADSSGAVQNILKSSDVWLKYKDQSHDLFLSTNNYGGLLANHGSNGSNAPPLALTSAVSVLHSDEPPPV